MTAVSSSAGDANSAMSDKTGRPRGALMNTVNCVVQYLALVSLVVISMWDLLTQRDAGRIRKPGVEFLPSHFPEVAGRQTVMWTVIFMIQGELVFRCCFVDAKLREQEYTKFKDYTACPTWAYWVSVFRSGPWGVFCLALMGIARSEVFPDFTAHVADFVVMPSLIGMMLSDARNYARVPVALDALTLVHHFVVVAICVLFTFSPMDSSVRWATHSAMAVGEIGSYFYAHYFVGQTSMPVYRVAMTLSNVYGLGAAAACAYYGWSVPFIISAVVAVGLLAGRQLSMEAEYKTWALQRDAKKE